MAKTYPHTKMMKDNGIELDSDIMSPSTRNSITAFNKLEEAYPGIEDATRKNMAATKMDNSSAKIVELLQADIDKDVADKAAAEKKAADKAAADKAKAEKEKTATDAAAAATAAAATAAAEKAAAEKAKADAADPKAAAAKKVAEDKAAADKAKEDAKKDNPYELSETQIEAKKIIDKLWSEKAKAGVMEITEGDMNEAGFNPWSHLGMTAGKLGPYNFKSVGWSNTWSVTKEKKTEPAKV